MKKQPYPAEIGSGWVLVQAILMAGCALLGWFWHGHWPGLSPSDWIASCLAMAGAMFGIAGICVLGRNRTIFPEPRADSVLVRHGVYRYVRHPLYSSVMLLAFAWGTWRQSVPAMCVAGVLCLFLILKSRNEEARLLRRFPEYATYRKTTRRFIPWLF